MQPEGVDLDEFEFDIKLDPTSVLSSPVSATACCRVQPFTQTVQKVGKGATSVSTHAEQTFALEMLNDPKVKLVGLTGKAGTGKTLRAGGR